MINETFDVNKLIELWNAKASASEIGKELGLTRNAVIGRIKRLRDKGVKLRSFTAAPKNEVSRVRVREVKTDRGWVKNKEPIKVKGPAQLHFNFDPPAEKPKRSIDILQLTPRSCRYITGEDNKRGALYCGDNKSVGSYCAEHAKMCYIPLKKSGT